MRSWITRPINAVIVAVAVAAAAAGGILIPGAGTGPGPAPTATPGPGTANAWVNTTAGDTKQRCATACAFDASHAFNSLAEASAAAAPGDTIRVRAGSYAPQNCSGPTGGVTVIGDDGAQIIGPTSGSFTANQGLALSANCTVQNIDVGGGKPFVFLGSNSQWRDSDLLEATIARTCSTSDPEPILIQKFTDPAITNATLGPNVRVHAQYGADAAHSGCGGAGTDPYHLEALRVDQKIDGATIDRVTFDAWPGANQPAGSIGYGSGQVFFDGFNGSSPTNVTIRNSVFRGPMGGSFHMQINDPIICANITLAYNTFENAEPLYVGCSSRTNIRYIGNVGSRPQNCLSGVTYTRNVWQRPSGTPCGTDTLITGPSFTVSALGLDSALRPLPGSAVVNAGEMGGYCTGALGSVDRDGNLRPAGVACDAGAYERQN